MTLPLELSGIYSDKESIDKEKALNLSLTLILYSSQFRFSMLYLFLIERIEVVSVNIVWGFRED